jgi:hypothetical protein
MRSPLLAASLLVLSTLLTQARAAEDTHREGRIVGTVINDEGEPIFEASVCIQITRSQETSFSCTGPRTDKNGQFALDHVPMEEVGVYADNTLAGYWANHSKHEAQKVRLTAEEPLARVVLTVGPRPGELKLTVKDKTTGQFLQSFNLRWITVDATNWVISSDSTAGKPVLIPPDTDVIVEVLAAGYRTWFYLDPSNSQPILRLASGERKELNVELQPEVK